MLVNSTALVRERFALIPPHCRHVCRRVTETIWPSATAAERERKGSNQKQRNLRGRSKTYVALNDKQPLYFPSRSLSGESNARAIRKAPRRWRLRCEERGGSESNTKRPEVCTRTLSYGCNT
ncbi:hypothetical protein MTO96_019888 [Rhipicephalus appendiculatus]